MASRPKLLVRAWLPRRGCCHLRSPEMTDAEARSLLDAARGAIDKAQVSGVVERVPSATGCAFVMARRSPDPNQPGRTAPGFVLVSIPDPDTFLRDAVADRLRAVELPESSDAALDGWEFLDPGVATIVPPNPDANPTWRHGIASLFKKRSPRKVANESSHAPWRGLASFRSRPWRVMTSGLVLLAVGLIASWYFNTFKHLLSGDALPTRSPGRSDGSKAANEKKWTRVREQIEELLQEPWAARIVGKPTNPGPRGPKTAKDPDNRRILSDFARLLQRPRLNLQATDKRNYDKRKSDEHPFVAFLNRLPEMSQEPPGGDAPLSATQALDFLEILKGELKTMGVDLDFDGAAGIAQPIKQALNYPEFYEKWTKRDSSALCQGPLDTEREKKRDYKWVGEVRKVIRKFYCPLGYQP